MPENKAAPIILIGSGTGVAPFRSFLYERLENGIEAPAWMFFGEQSFRHSFFYQTDWLNLLEKKVLSELTPAFSRDKRHPAYVQNRLRENGKEIYRWIERGAYIYVCGSAEGMGAEVHQTLQDIIAEQSGVSKVTAKQKLQQLMIEGYYKRDVY